MTMPEKIYLLPNEGLNGETVWCDHIPTDDHEIDAKEYIRADVVEALLKQAHDNALQADEIVTVMLSSEDVPPSMKSHFLDFGLRNREIIAALKERIGA